MLFPVIFFSSFLASCFGGVDRVWGGGSVARVLLRHRSLQVRPLLTATVYKHLRPLRQSVAKRLIEQSTVSVQGRYQVFM